MRMRQKSARTLCTANGCRLLLGARKYVPAMEILLSCDKISFLLLRLTPRVTWKAVHYKNAFNLHQNSNLPGGRKQGGQKHLQPSTISDFSRSITWWLEVLRTSGSLISILRLHPLSESWSTLLVERSVCWSTGIDHNSLSFSLWGLAEIGQFEYSRQTTWYSKFLQASFLDPWLRSSLGISLKILNSGRLPLESKEERSSWNLDSRSFSIKISAELEVRIPRWSILNTWLARM